MRMLSSGVQGVVENFKSKASSFCFVCSKRAQLNYYTPLLSSNGSKHFKLVLWLCFAVFLNIVLHGYKWWFSCYFINQYFVFNNECFKFFHGPFHFAQQGQVCSAIALYLYIFLVLRLYIVHCLFTCHLFPDVFIIRCCLNSIKSHHPHFPEVVSLKLI